MRSSHPVLLQGSQRLVDAVDKFVDMFKVLGHLGGKHHVNDCLAELSILIPGGRDRQRSQIRT